MGTSDRRDCGPAGHGPGAQPPQPPDPDQPPGSRPAAGGQPAQAPRPYAPPAPAARQPPLASWESRAKAYVIDLLVLLVPALILFLIFVAPGLEADTEPGSAERFDDEVNFALLYGTIAFFVLMVPVVVIWALYVLLLMIRKGERNGQTWGKQVVGIRAVRDNGKSWGFGSAALREVVLKLITAVVLPSLVIPIIPALVNFLWPLWDGENRTLHDIAVSSHVVRA